MWLWDQSSEDRSNPTNEFPISSVMIIHKCFNVKVCLCQNERTVFFWWIWTIPNCFQSWFEGKDAKNPRGAKTAPPVSWLTPLFRPVHPHSYCCLNKFKRGPIDYSHIYNYIVIFNLYIYIYCVFAHTYIYIYIHYNMYTVYYSPIKNVN